MSDRLTALRDLLRRHEISAYIIPSTDPHQGEYTPAFWQRRAYLTGFTGSAGDAVVTLNEAFLWTDFRYYLQAEQELSGSGFTLMKQGQKGVPTYGEWLATSLPRGGGVGLDPALFSIHGYQQLKSYLAERDLVVKSIEENLVDLIWGARPGWSPAPIRSLDLTRTGQSTTEKLSRIREALTRQGADYHLVTTLDCLAWLFNLRGGDVVYNPVFLGYALIGKNETRLYCARSALTPDAKKSLEGIANFCEYDTLAADLAALPPGCRLWVDPDSCPALVAEKTRQVKLLPAPSPIVPEKAKKNPVEIDGIRRAHVRDGVALVKFLRWLSEQTPSGTVTELSAAEQLERFRREGEWYQGPSFETISAYRDHAAIVHYRPTPEGQHTLASEGLYLIDSGGQYLDGTTDVTRTVSLGEPTPEQKNAFTRVLKGHILLDRTPFPVGARSSQLDSFARLALWQGGLEYGHGTGHGVGCYLCVHEGPQSISPYRGWSTFLEPGMVCSNEPGYYRAGQFGMRFENLFVVVPSNLPSPDGPSFLTCEALTLCPIDLKLLDFSLLTGEEIFWIDAYHRKVQDRLNPYLDEATRRWLKKYCDLPRRKRRVKRVVRKTLQPSQLKI